MSGHSNAQPADFVELRSVTGDELRALVARSPKIGARLVESAAKSGLTTAQLTWARMLLEGHGVPRDHAAAHHWFALAARSGDAEALNMVGRCYEHGWGVAADRRQAAVHYRLAARTNFACAQYNLGQLLLSGEPIPAERREGLGWHLVAAKSGHSKSMNVIGRFCEEGWDMPKSVDNALGWYRKAADGGDSWGQFNLGRLLADDGNVEEGVVWLRKAMETGNEEFIGNIAPVLLERPEPELKAIGQAVLDRRRAKAKAASRAETEQPDRGRRPARRGKGWFKSGSPRPSAR
jgi:TPR repeat protein